MSILNCHYLHIALTKKNVACCVCVCESARVSVGVISLDLRVYKISLSRRALNGKGKNYKDFDEKMYYLIDVAVLMGSFCFAVFNC